MARPGRIRLRVDPGGDSGADMRVAGTATRDWWNQPVSRTHARPGCCHSPLPSPSDPDCSSTSEPGILDPLSALVRLAVGPRNRRTVAQRPGSAAVRLELARDCPGKRLEQPSSSPGCWYSLLWPA